MYCFYNLSQRLSVFTVQLIFAHCLIVIFLSTDTREMFEFSEIRRHGCWEIVSFNEREIDSLCFHLADMWVEIV